MALRTNTLLCGDCLKQFKTLEDGCIDLVFADPPFNIGYKYDVYDDRRACDEYLKWCQKWIKEIRRVLKPSGTFWLAIGDEFAAELKLIAQQQAGFTCRSWIIWYYTFGVNCRRGFSRSHTHLFHFVANPREFTFNSDNPAVRVPSARQLVYGDLRANPSGRLPDNTWILRPQDAPPNSFTPLHDTWYFARVAGTFKEREGFHGCQMPEQLLGRIIRVSSNPRDIVLDPFSGSGTTLAVAKKLGRQWLGFELSPEYAKRIQERLNKTLVGAELDGPADPVRSAPKTAEGRALGQIQNARMLPRINEDEERAIIEAYRRTERAESVDFVLCQPEVDAEFIDQCQKSGLPGNAYAWNRLLLRIRKSGKLPRATSRSKRLSFAEMDPYSFASEIAMQSLVIDYGLSVDDILCEPMFAEKFDGIAAEFARGYTPFEYRWAALAIRKRARQSKLLATERFAEWLNGKLPQGEPIDRIADRAPSGSGVYVLTGDDQQHMYVGEALDIGRRMEQLRLAKPWEAMGISTVTIVPSPQPTQHGLQSALIHRTQSLLNLKLLRPRLQSAG